MPRNSRIEDIERVELLITDAQRARLGGARDRHEGGRGDGAQRGGRQRVDETSTLDIHRMTDQSGNIEAAIDRDQSRLALN
ncbi:MAG: hypothetical protein V4793_41375 [Paraburkholderia tropica]